MSHFNVGVVIDDLSKLDDYLAPYDEHLKVEKYVYRTKSQLIEDAKAIKEKFMNPKYSSSLPEAYKNKFINAKTDDELYEAIKKDYSEYDENGNALSTYNPNSKYDYYSEIDRSLVKNFKRDIDTDAYDAALKEWEAIVEDPDNKAGDQYFRLYNPEFYINRYKNKETYATICATPHTYALVVDGKWFEKGKCGWFGHTDTTYETIMTYLNKFNEVMSNPKFSNYFFVILDCHI